MTLPADRTDLNLQKHHPNGTQLIVSTIRFAPSHTSVELNSINGGKQEVELNGNGQSMLLRDDQGDDYFPVPPGDNEEVAVAAYLRESFRIEAGRLRTRAFGASRPVAPNTLQNGSDNPTGRQCNRRVEIVVGTTAAGAAPAGNDAPASVLRRTR